MRMTGAWTRVSLRCMWGIPQRTLRSVGSLPWRNRSRRVVSNFFSMENVGMKDTGFSGCRLMGMILLAFSFCASPFAGQAATRHDPRLEGAYSFERNGWTYIHLQGTPEQIGYQHGYLLAAKIEDAVAVYKLENEHSTHRDWAFYRDATKTMLWPHIDREYQEELSGIAEGVKAKGVKLDAWDIVALNATMELSEYYVPWLNKQQHAKNAPKI